MRGIVATICFVLFINLFPYHPVGPLGITSILVALLVFLVFVHGRKHIFRSPVLSLVAPIALVSSLIVTFRAAGVIQFVSVCVTFYLLATFAYVAGSDGVFFRNLSELILLPFHLVRPYISGVGQAWKHLSGGRTGKREGLKSLLVGLIIGIPVALVLLGLLSGADPIFAYATRALNSSGMIQRIVTHVVLSCIVFIGLVPVSFLAVKRPLTSVFSGFGRLSLSREMTVVGFLVALVVGAFLVVQWPYVFARVAAETDLSRFGVATYSEYVKRGFVELVAIAAVLYGIVWAGLLVLRGRETNKALSVVQLVLIVELSIFILSIVRRVWLYIQFHGLSLSRVYGSFFLITVAFMLATLIGRHRAPRIPWVRVEAAGLAVLFFLFGLINMEHIVSVWHPPTVNGRVDYIYLSRLSSDGYAGWHKAYENAQTTLFSRRYEQTDVLGERDREAIDYAGIMLMQLTRQYHRLIMHYGSSEDQQAYVQKLLSFQGDMIDSILPEISRAAAGERDRGVKNGQSSYAEQELISQRAWVTERMKQSLPDPSEILPRVSTGYVSLEYYLPSGAPVTFYRIAIDGNDANRRLDTWDRVYLWNRSELVAWRRMKRDMPFEMLLSMQRVYTQLAARIARQPDAEQGYQRDVSFDGPFLAPL